MFMKTVSRDALEPKVEGKLSPELPQFTQSSVFTAGSKFEYERIIPLLTSKAHLHVFFSRFCGEPYGNRGNFIQDILGIRE